MVCLSDLWRHSNDLQQQQKSWAEQYTFSRQHALPLSEALATCDTNLVEKHGFDIA